MRGGATLSGAERLGCSTTESCSGDMGGGTTVSSCSLSPLIGVGMIFPGLGGALGEGGGFSSLVISISLFGNVNALTCKQLSIGVDSRISVSGNGSDGSSSRTIGSFDFFIEQKLSSYRFV